MSKQNGVLINAEGTIASVVYGWGSAAVPPDGQTFMATQDTSGLAVGQPAVNVFIASVKEALSATDTTMFRINEATSLGLTTASAPDVVAWVNYRRALRDLLKASTITELPHRPSYPAGT